jgi:hypothetical protein
MRAEMLAAVCVNRRLFSSYFYWNQNTKRIRKVSTVCEYFRRSAEVVILRMRVVFPHLLASHRRPYEKTDSVCLLFCACKMFKVIDRPADCEIESVIRFFWMQETWNRLIFIVRYVKYSVKMPWVMEWWGNWLKSSKKVVITCMTSRGASGRLWPQTATFYEEEIQKLVPRYCKWLNNGGNYVEEQFKVWRIW